MKLRDKLLKFKKEHGIMVEVPCTEEETAKIKEDMALNRAIPTNVYYKEDTSGVHFYKLASEDEMFDAEETRELIALFRLDRLTSIRNWLIAATALSFLGVLLLLFVLL